MIKNIRKWHNLLMTNLCPVKMNLSKKFNSKLMEYCQNIKHRNMGYDFKAILTLVSLH